MDSELPPVDKHHIPTTRCCEQDEVRRKAGEAVGPARQEAKNVESVTKNKSSMSFARMWKKGEENWNERIEVQFDYAELERESSRLHSKESRTEVAVVETVAENKAAGWKELRSWRRMMDVELGDDLIRSFLHGKRRHTVSNFLC